MREHRKGKRRRRGIGEVREEKKRERKGKERKNREK